MINQLDPLLLPFILYSLIFGTYFGLFNHKIFHSDSKKEPNIHERCHNLVAHIICSFIGSLSMYLLVKVVVNQGIDSLQAEQVALCIFLFIVGSLGLIGELPLAFWFLAKKGLPK